MRRTSFREGGLPHSLIVIADLSVPLREEELKAWQRIVRVLGHELNNSLAPIKSIAGSLSVLLKHGQRAPDWEDDMRSGLEIIATRADGLGRFMQAYARLAKLPQPTLAATEVAPIIRRAAALETRLPVAVLGGPDFTANLDAAQVEQVLINLIKNAVEAVHETSGGVRVVWRKQGAFFEVRVEDDGPGIANTANLFVPFFTTKPSGSGIGLLLCRQIAENHGGTLNLRNRDGGTPGCIATLRLPV
jgi:nitrogen fixation/metabolism regulation signal transduction histidine kinase